jgi:hypothetical protein
MKLKAHLVGSLIALFLTFGPRPLLAAKKHAALRTPVAEYPMKADEFRALTDKRIERLWGTIEKKLDRRSVSAERKKSLRKLFDEAARETRAQVSKAAADGIVTQAEGDQVKRLALGIRLRLRERIRAEKMSRVDADGHAQGKNARLRHPKKEGGAPKSTSTHPTGSRRAGAPSDESPEATASSTRPSDSAPE